MSVDKLVDSTQLDSDLTSVANAIRTKGGTSAQLAFPAGFVSAIDAIPTGGGTSIQSGSFTAASATKTFTVELTEAVTHFVFYASDYPAGTAGAGWHVVGGLWVNGSLLFNRMRYNEANDSCTISGSVSQTADSLTVSGLQYNVLSGKTFYWYAW